MPRETGVGSPGGHRKIAWRIEYGCRVPDGASWAKVEDHDDDVRAVERFAQLRERTWMAADRWGSFVVLLSREAVATTEGTDYWGPWVEEDADIWYGQAQDDENMGKHRTERVKQLQAIMRDNSTTQAERRAAFIKATGELAAGMNMNKEIGWTERDKAAVTG